MCTGAEVGALAVAAAGTAASINAQQRAESDRKKTLMQGIEAESALQDKSNDMTKDYVKETYDPLTRSQNYETQASDRESALGSLLSQQSSNGMGDISPSTTGAVSDTYTRAKAASAADAGQRARTLSKLLSRGGAAGNLFGQEALNGADYSSSLLGLGVQSGLNRNLTGFKYGAAGQSGNNAALLGGLLSGASRGIGGMSGSWAGTQAPAPLQVINVPS